MAITIVYSGGGSASGFNLSIRTEYIGVRERVRQSHHTGSDFLTEHITFICKAVIGFELIMTPLKAGTWVHENLHSPFACGLSWYWNSLGKYWITFRVIWNARYHMSSRNIILEERGKKGAYGNALEIGGWISIHYCGQAKKRHRCRHWHVVGYWLWLN